MKQKYTSKRTSVNVTRVPVLFNKVDWNAHACRRNDWINFDYGCGKSFGIVNTFLKRKGIKNISYDPYNLSHETNIHALRAVDGLHGVDSVTCSNVLNVVMEDSIRTEIIGHIKSLLVDYGVAYFTVYEGNKTGVIKIDVKRDSVQLNRKAKTYVQEIRNVFGIDNVYISKNGLITAIKR